MQDLTLAKSRLKENSLALVIVKDRRVIFESRSSGMASFADAIEKCGGELSGASLADKILGRAAAILCAYAKIVAVFAVIASKTGIETLRRARIPLQFETCVSDILNRARTDKCPFEKLIETTEDPGEAFRKIRNLVLMQRV